MPPRPGFRGAALLLLALTLGLAGCPTTEKPGVAVSGKIQENGKPFTLQVQNLPPGDPGLRIAFYKQDDSGKPSETFFATVQPSEGTFSMPGKGIPLGKYRISLTVGAMGKPDQLKNVFSETASPLIVDISAPCNVLIDISTKKATVQ